MWLNILAVCFLVTGFNIRRLVKRLINTIECSAQTKRIAICHTGSRKKHGKFLFNINIENNFHS